MIELLRKEKKKSYQVVKKGQVVSLKRKPRTTFNLFLPNP